MKGKKTMSSKPKKKICSDPNVQLGLYSERGGGNIDKEKWMGQNKFKHIVSDPKQKRTNEQRKIHEQKKKTLKIYIEHTKNACQNLTNERNKSPTISI